MTDDRIVELYFERSQSAIEETDKKFGKLCRRIAKNILHSSFDAEECQNDTLLKVWNSIPPNRPENLSAYVCRIARNTALDRYTKGHSQKRGAKSEQVFDELEEAIPANGLSVADSAELKIAINGFIESLSQPARGVFLRRYWYFCPIKDIADDCGLTQGNVKVILSRTRQSFKAYLEKEGITL